MRLEDTHKLMGFYIEVVLILGVILHAVHDFCFLELFLIGCIGLIKADHCMPMVVLQWNSLLH